MSRRLRTACGLAAVVLALAGGTARAEEPLFAVEPQLPGDDDAGRRLEAVLLVRDLRAYHAEGERQRTRLRRTSPGDSLLAPGEQRRIFGFDGLEELGRLLDLADPDGRGAVAAGAAVFSTPEGIGFQLLLQAAPGFPGRLAAARRSERPPAWAAPDADDGISLALGGRVLTGLQDDDGWVRLAPRAEMLAAGPAGAAVLTGELRTRLRGCDEALVLRGGGRLAAALARRPEGGMAAGLLGAARGAAVGLARDREGTAELRLVLDHPLLAQLGPMLIPPDPANPFFPLWGLEATEFLSLRLPPLALAAGTPALLARLSAGDHPPPEAVLAALRSFDGSLGYARFGTPGDWALGLHFAEEETAVALLPALRGWLADLGEEEGRELLRAVAAAAVPSGDGSALVFPPDSGLGHLGVVRAGRFLLVVSQPSRRDSLAAAAGRRRRGRPALSEGVRAALERPALLSAHKVLGNEFSLLGGSGLFALLARERARAESAREGDAAGDPFAAYTGAALAHLPALARLAEAQFDLTYDLNLRAEVVGGLLVVQLLSSELPARGRYLEAVNRKFAGDRTGYYDGLMDLARRDAEGRAGRRARVALLYNPLGEVALAGVLAAVAIPNYLKFKARAARAKDLAALRALRAALLAHEAEGGEPCGTLAECGEALGAEPRWLYFIGTGEDQVAGGAGAPDRAALLREARALLEERGVAPDPGGERAVAAAVGDPGGAGRLEVWAIDRTGEPYEVPPRRGPRARPGP